MAERVAVIAVHGVGSPPRDSTARALTTLLLEHAPDGVRYEWFTERAQSIATAPVDVGEAPIELSTGRRRGIQRAFTYQAGDRTSLDTDPDVATRPDIAFMRTLLRGYKGRHDAYDTIERIGLRRDEHGETEVHVFEMHWADLSRLGSGLVRVLGAVYQLVQHISHIGRKTVDIAAQVARAQHRTGSQSDQRREVGPYRAWAWYSAAHAWAIRAFTVLVPVATLLMFACLALFVPAAIQASSRLEIGIAFLTLVVVTGGGIAIYLGPADRRSATIFVGFMLVVLAAALRVITDPPADPVTLGTVLSTVSVVTLVAAAVWRILAAYNESRSGALWYGAVAVVAILIATAVSSDDVMLQAGVDLAERVRQVGLVAFEWAYVLLMMTWGVLWLIIVAAVALRLVLTSQTTGLARRRLSRAAWTARVTLAVSVFSYIVAALVAYRSMVYLAARMGSFDLFPHALTNGQLPLIRAPGLVPTGFVCFNGTTDCAERFFVKLIAQGGTSGFVLAVLGLAMVGVLVSWFVALVVATSIHAPDPTRGNSRRLGLWMSDGFRWLRLAGTMLAVTLFIAILVGVLLDIVAPLRVWMLPRLPRWLAARMNTDWAGDVIGTLTVAVLASAATAGAVRLRLETLAARARPAVGVILDVDNYLRETPDKATPRARIAERFTSLLRHLHAHGSFDRVIIVSHSQGTVISTDLLRFLSLGLDPASADHRLVSPGRFRLLTMGSPLRQLYGANFPHLYAWVNASDPAPDDQRARVPRSATATPDIISKTPMPAELRVGRWVNLYTSGDYVGRNLWCDDDWEGVWDRRSRGDAVQGGGRRERCLGAGTHTHYWESPDVAAEVDRLIIDAHETAAAGSGALGGVLTAAHADDSNRVA